MLGCSGAKFPGHNVPGFLLDNDLLFDAGTISSVLDEKAQLKIKYIFITHAHLDHIRAIPFLADNVIVGQHKHTFSIVSIPQVIRTIKKHLFNSAVWPDFSLIPDPNHAVINFIELKMGKSLEMNGYTITPYKVNHTVPAVGYLVEDRKKRRFFYTGDMGPSSTLWKKIADKRLNCLIIDVSFPNELRELALNTGHMTPELLREELNKMSHIPKQICIAHIKPQYLKEIQKELKGLKIRNLKVLKDGNLIRI